MVKSESREKLSAAQANRIRQHLDEVLGSAAFIGSKRSRSLLQLLVEDALAGHFDNLHERVIGVRMYGREPNYDTANDAIVRVNVTEVRKRLAQYYRELDTEPAVRIELPSGTYLPNFLFRNAGKSARMSGQTPESAANVAGDNAVESTPIAPLLPAHTQPDVALLSLVSAKEIRPAQKRARTGILIWGLLSVAVTCAVAAALWFGIRGKAPAAAIQEPPPPTVLVLPLTNLSGDRTQEYFADGITAELIADLGQFSGLRTISQTSAMSFKQTHKTLPEIARELQVQWVVEGSVQRSGKHVRVTAELIDAATDHPVWSTSYMRDIGDTLKAQAELALAVAEKIRIEIEPKTRERFGQVRPVNEKAQQLYLQGMMLLQSSTSSAHSEQGKMVQDAMQLFEKAVALDPSFAQPHAAEAEAYSRLVECGILPSSKAYPLQKAEARRAIELNPSLAEGHAELASATIDLDYDWATARMEFHKALDLNPGSVSVRLRYALFLVKSGEPAKAVEEVELCRKLDPLSARLLLEAEYIYFYSRKYDELLALDNDGVGKHIVAEKNNELLGMVSLARGLNGKAIEELKTSQMPTGIGRLGVAYARTGQIEAANATIRTLKTRLDRSGVGTYEIALIYATLGKRNEAFAWLNKGMALHDKGLTYLKIDPCLDPLRSDARFTELLKRTGFAA